MQTNTIGVLVDALQCAATAHQFHEDEIGALDPDWAHWFALHMAETLREGGYRLSHASPNGSDLSR